MAILMTILWGLFTAFLIFHFVRILKKRFRRRYVEGYAAGYRQALQDIGDDSKDGKGFDQSLLSWGRWIERIEVILKGVDDGNTPTENISNL
jgi:hypothetical protein